MTPEAKVKKKVYKLLKDNGAYYFSPIMGGYGKAGVPDIIACYKGKFLGIECKAGNNVPTKLQWANLKQIQNVGGISLVINENNLGDLENNLRRIDG